MWRTAEVPRSNTDEEHSPTFVLFFLFHFLLSTFNSKRKESPFFFTDVFSLIIPDAQNQMQINLKEVALKKRHTFDLE